MTTGSTLNGVYRNGLETLNTRGHRISLWVFMVIVIAHWAEHVAQAIQIYVMNWPIPEANGVIGLAFPWMVTSEWLHYGYAFIMLVGLALLLPGFTGRSRTWWLVSFWLQMWHHFEHLLLLLQALSGIHLGGGDTPMSLIQLLIPRVELHLFYNAMVFVPMVVAMYLHSRPNDAELKAMRCSCAAQDREEEEEVVR